ncbi:hypothetical protein FV226_11130 [Methylobacterium sp. WL12]|uniref:hypothetical protein n=1 Tax=Methylobacterium sp. WL12 TaxID=2603890 RepID=UPI0011C77CEF|nr:hypothetical protein [Methylobacterium sp. WL12]TXM72893.1 hypothetical protein FV226_11130 [Methylobacterium sp. WL12]
MAEHADTTATLTSRRDRIDTLISDMEYPVSDLARWGEVVRCLGTTDEPDCGAIIVVGDAILTLAKRIQADWDQAFRLTRPVRESAR